MNFKFSNDWFEKFKARNELVYKVIRGKSKEVELGVCENWKNDIFEKIHDEYDERDIFNAHETGLAYKALPDNTFTFQGIPCKGTKI